ncbi:trehalase family glycosidase [Archangium sp.]|uniref:trehalase family glycosidase n=1 Tax=Archangium sp. TaxID=1872627 RepID=UPI00286D108A|nr:trehalase family glycosidase [Archangium sp.]
MGHVHRRARALVLVLEFAVVFSAAAQAPAPQAPPEQREDYPEVRAYISKSWDVLRRSMTDCNSLMDPKVPERSVLYLPKDVPLPESVRLLERKCPKLRVLRLPEDISGPGQVDTSRIQPQGLLYLEHAYVVPGGRFNEMYGWDSYFIIRGLLRDGRPELARGMVRNFFYELEHYGAVLNANRTYYLSRSQPPFLSAMVREVYEDERRRTGREDRKWLAEAYPYVVKDYEMWTRAPHLAGDTGLSRYYDFGEGPVPEVVERGEDYYRHTVMSWFLRHREEARPWLVESGEAARAAEAAGPEFFAAVCEQQDGKYVCTTTESLRLTADYYKGDRAMRESGFDVTFHYGPFAAGTHHHASVALNSLLYKTEEDLAFMSSRLGRETDARQWHQRAAQRQARMNRYSWDARAGLFLDWNVKTGQRNDYVYATTLYPLWAGLASKEQAEKVVRRLSDLEQPGGLAMSRTETGTQWDYPYGWAPIQLLAVEGLRRYGYRTEADRLSRKFLDMVAEDFRREGNLREKYDVVQRTSETRVKRGDYTENVIGFGWTNGVFLELLHGLRAQEAPARPPVGRRAPKRPGEQRPRTAP